MCTARACSGGRRGTLREAGRATAAALFLFILNIIGLGLWPQSVGLLSTRLRPELGVDSLRYALLLTMVSGTLGGISYWRASKTLKADLARVPKPA